MPQHEDTSPGWWGRAWPALLAVGTVGAVGAPAAVASYRHARDVIAVHGDPVMAPWLPLSVDGMLVAALVVIWVRRYRGDRAGAFPALAFCFGGLVTVAANLAAVTRPTPVAYAVAIFPPVALAITLELVALIAYRSGRSRATDGQAADSVALDSDEPIVISYLNEVDEHNHRSPDWWADAPAVDEGQDLESGEGHDDGRGGLGDGAPGIAAAAADGDPRVQDLARRLADGEELTGAAVGERFEVSARTGRRLIQQASDHLRGRDVEPGRLALVPPERAEVS